MKLITHTHIQIERETPETKCIPEQTQMMEYMQIYTGQYVHTTTHLNAAKNNCGCRCVSVWKEYLALKIHRSTFQVWLSKLQTPFTYTMTHTNTVVFIGFFNKLAHTHANI